jgi:peptide/nickel transport system substrate-binding protein
MAVVLARPGQCEPAHGIAMHGLPKLAPGFHHFPYVNPNAPKGGRLVLGGWGSFDSLNPMIVKGEPALGVREFTIESLMARSLDEPFTLYGLIAESIDVPPERNEVTFRLNPKAHFSDGSPVTADDVLFSWSLLKEKSRPNFMTYYKKVVSAERIDERTVRFVLGGADREMPLILGLMPVLPKHATDAETFEATSLVPPIGSGPYKITKVDPGHTLTYELDPNYWGRDLSTTRGRFNFAEIRFDYYRDGAVLLEAFKTGAIDVRTEEDPSRWAEAYAFQAVTSGRVKKVEIPTGLPAGMTGLVFNTRRAVFADPRVREALIQLFNFEWIDKNLFHGLYQRTESFFERSSLASTGKPADAYERALLAPFPDAVRPDILSGTYRMPVSDGSGHNRANARRAIELLAEAGYKLGNGRLRRADGARLTFEILAGGVAQERLLNSFAGDLDKLGIDVSIRTVDSAQYQARLKDYDFDMIQFTWPASLSPGNEQLFRWSSKVAGQPGSFNYAGIANPAADAMIAALLAGDSPHDFASSVRALDRVLLSGHYVIPLFHIPRQWVAHWDRVRHPDTFPLSGYNLDSWWIEGRP